MSFLLLIGPLGPFEILVILFVGLMIFGSRLPEVGKSLGKGLMEFKRGMRGLQDEMDSIDREADLRVDEELEKRAIPTNPAEEHAHLDDGHDLQGYDPSTGADPHSDYDEEDAYEDDPHLEPGPEFGGDPQPDADQGAETAEAEHEATTETDTGSTVEDNSGTDDRG